MVVVVVVVVVVAVTFRTGCTVVVCDAKVNFDDNAEFRQSDIFAMRDVTQVRVVCCL